MKNVKNEFVTIAEYAKHVDVSRQSVEKAITRGRIPESVIKRVAKGKRSCTLIHQDNADVYWTKYASLYHSSPQARDAVERIRQSRRDEPEIPEYIVRTADIILRFDLTDNVFNNAFIVVKILHNNDDVSLDEAEEWVRMAREYNAGRTKKDLPILDYLPYLYEGVTRYPISSKYSFINHV